MRGSEIVVEEKPKRRCEDRPVVVRRLKQKCRREEQQQQQVRSVPYQASPAVKEAVGRAEAFARKWLAEKDDVDSETIVKALREIGNDWPTQSRPNVTDTGRPVPGLCLGLVFALGQGAQCSHASEAHPYLTRLLTKWCSKTLPRTKAGRVFPYSSLQINYNYRAIKHVDANNIGPSYIMSLGDHEGGELWTSDRGVIDCRGRWRLFDGNKEHETRPFRGRDRISFIAFAHEQYSKLARPVVDQLRDLGFTAARSDGLDDEFFERFRIERSYLSEAHNQAFRACLQERRGETILLENSGDVAVECFGRQAEKGGGWMAFNGRDGVAEVLDLKENSVGIWYLQLNWTRNGQLELAKHDRLNFYANMGAALRELQKRIREMPSGSPVVLGIADTAVAASRPLTKAVYETLHTLGAPLDMPAIQYRAAWAMIGFKGAKPGQALTAMGTRSTLLRLDATFTRQQRRAGDDDHSSIFETSVRARKPPDLTSIIDVVTGGGQDEAVEDPSH